MMNIGEKLPNFELPDTSGATVTRDQLMGAPLVLFFYPRDNTSGCTRESIDFSTAQADFAALGVAIYGVSKDSVKSHQNFTTKQNLTVPLLSDENGTLCEDMGVWKEKKMYGKTFMGIERTTVLVDATGTIRHIWPKVKVPGHVDAVLEAAKAL